MSFNEDYTLQLPEYLKQKEKIGRLIERNLPFPNYSTRKPDLFLDDEGDSENSYSL